MSQNKKVLQYMKQHGSITAQEAVKHLNIYRLAARIYDLRNSGNNITSVDYPGKHGSFGSYTRYYLEVSE